MLLILCSIFLVSVVSALQEDYCYANEERPYLMYGTKTAYEFIHEKPRNPESIPYCQPIQFWLLTRHGTRYPSKKVVTDMPHLRQIRDQIIGNHESRRQGRLCEDDLENLRQWTLEVFPGQADDLANQGYDDLKFMARRFKTQFPLLLNRSHQQDMFEFRFTKTQRTKSSAVAFAEGLFGSRIGVNFPEPYENDTLIRGYKACPRWLREVDNNSRTFNERNLFENDNIMQKLAQNISERLGFAYKLPFSEINKMYDMCRFDKAWNIRKVSAWCAAFSKEELQLLEYRDDLEEYYRNGYGNDLNIKLGCPPVKDFMYRFSQIEAGNHQPVGVFYFTHAPMIQMLLSRLGIAKDSETLTHSNYNNLKNRKWKTSKISPFASNLAVVFYRCDQGEKHRVIFYLGERLVPYEGCNVGLCSWSYIKERFEQIANECSLDFCSSDWSGSSQNHAASWILVGAIIMAVFYRQSIL